MRCVNVLDDGFVFFFDRAIDFIVFVNTLDGKIGRNFQNFETVNIAELFRFRCSRTGHAGELGIHAEIVLESDRSQCLVFRLDRNLFLRFQCLMETFRITAARHHATSKLVNDDDFVIADDIVFVALEQFMRPQRVVQVMDDRDILDVVQAFAFQMSRSVEKLLDLFGADFGEDGCLLLLVDLKIFRLKSWNESVDEVVEVGAIFERAGNDQRRTRFVNED